MQLHGCSYKDIDTDAMPAKIFEAVSIKSVEAVDGKIHLYLCEAETFVSVSMYLYICVYICLLEQV